jgi:hypothetical protein
MSMLLALTAVLYLAGAEPSLGARPHVAVRHGGAICQRKRGHTILHRGVVRLFKGSGTVYGCLRGSRRAWQLWGVSGDPFQAMSGAARQVAGPFVAFLSESSNQYTRWRTLAVEDLRSGASYPIADWEEEMGIHVTAQPPTPGPWPLDAFRLGPDGRTARLYNTYVPPTSALAESMASPAGQILDLIGFDDLQRQLATSAPGGIVSSSLSYDGHTVTWTHNGSVESASV